jgi:hypothetical protein
MGARRGKKEKTMQWKDIMSAALGVAFGLALVVALVVGLGYWVVKIKERRKIQFATEVIEAAIANPKLWELVLNNPKLKDRVAGEVKVLHDPAHDCDYVIVGNTVWCWRGNTPLGVSRN